MPLKVFGKERRIGLQLYSVREDCARDLHATLKAIAGMGYDGVEFASFYDIPARDIKRMLDDTSLVCCGSHTAHGLLQDDTLEATVAFNKALDNPYLICPWFKSDTRSDWEKAAAFFDGLAGTLAKQGMFTGYHNHAHEFRPLEGDRPWDIFFGNTRNEVIMQIDTGNALLGGGDPIDAVRRYPGRAVTVHLKEHSASKPEALIGDGDMDWQGFFAACDAARATEWFIVEQETYPASPLQSVAGCIDNLRRME